MKKIWKAGRLALLGMISVAAYAQTITFEPDSNGLFPDGSVVSDDTAISNQYLRSGVLFAFDNDMDGFPDMDGYPFLEKIGDDGMNGFLVTTDSGNYKDYADGGTTAQLGQYFLRTAAVAPNTAPDTLLVSYVNPVKQASGEIWDLDASEVDYEQWTIEALDENRQVITNVTTPAGIHYDLADSLDGLPWSFNIGMGDTTNEISALRFVCSGTRTQYIGLAFNNFSPAQNLATTNVIGVATIHPALEISWFSQLGYTYQLQWTQGLGNQWHNIGGSLEGTGAELTVFDSSRRAEKRMYRVLETN
jgi:hypothetical protein